MTIPFDVKNRWTGKVSFTAQIDCDPAAPLSLKLGLAVRWAVKEKADLRSADLTSADLRSADLRSADLRSADLRSADLRSANLRSADLRSADLTSANLRSADLRSADLTSANLRSADLRSADLTSANLRSADLRSANLRSANLTSANLTSANLTSANLTSADLRSADLTSANLRSADLRSADLRSANLRSADLTSADLRSFKADLWMTLSQARAEVSALVMALREGRVDGSTYEGECACLVGTLSNAHAGNRGFLADRDANHPAEQWFLMIRKGDRPGDFGEDGKETGGGYAARMALEWTLEYCALTGIALPEAEVVQP